MEAICTTWWGISDPWSLSFSSFFLFIDHHHHHHHSHYHHHHHGCSSWVIVTKVRPLYHLTVIMAVELHSSQWSRWLCLKLVHQHQLMRQIGISVWLLLSWIRGNSNCMHCWHQHLNCKWQSFYVWSLDLSNHFLQILKPIKVLSNDESSFDHQYAARVWINTIRPEVKNIMFHPSVSHLKPYVFFQFYFCLFLFFWLFGLCFLCLINHTNHLFHHYLRHPSKRNWNYQAHGARPAGIIMKRRCDMKLGINLDEAFSSIISIFW